MKSEVLCVSNGYEKKYYLNPAFTGMPELVKKELQVACVLYTEDVGGILTLEFDQKGKLLMHVMYEKGDPTYDEIGSEYKMRALRKEKQELLEGLTAYYEKVVKGKEA